MCSAPAVDVASTDAAAMAVSMPTTLYVVQRVRAETADTFTVDLVPADGKSAEYAPGQFNMVYVPGVGEVPISISGDPAKPDRLVHTVRAVGAVTRAMRHVRRGSVLGVRGPFGVGWPIDVCTDRDVVVVAGGIGLAPLRPAIYRLLAERDRYRRLIILYGCRTPSDLLFRRDLEHWRSRFDVHAYVTVDSAEAGWYGYVGVVPGLIAKAPFTPERTVAMICGPEVMMRFAAMHLAERGVAPSDIYLSMERNMKCGIGLCGHCQYGAHFICKDGPVFPYARISGLLARREV